MSDIRLIKEDGDLDHIVIRYDWDVMINGRPYYVVKIDGYIHTIGGRWGDNDLWAYPRDETPSRDNLIEFDSDEPVSWGIYYDEHNFTKTKWDETEVYCSRSAIITRNGRKFDRVFGNMNYAIDKARVGIAEFHDHPLELDTIDFDKKMIGRKVWWRSEPAVVENFIWGDACVILAPDGIDHFTVPKEFEEEDPEYYEDHTVKTSILDKHIWWFRN